MIKQFIHIFIFIVSLTVFFSCAASRTDVAGIYSEQIHFTRKPPVKVLFDFSYYTQEMGLDAIPKFSYSSGISDFDDIFKESIKQLSNIEAYETFTNSATDIDKPDRRNERESNIKNSDYVIKLDIHRENSFTKHVLGYLITLSSLNLIPVAYSWDYAFTINIIKKEEGFVAKYSRTASVTNWHQILLIALYPFHPEERKTEEIYLESLTDIFKQIENENILD